MALAVAEEQTTKTELTADDLWRHPTGEKYELVKGELVEMTPPGGLHGSIAVHLSALLVNFAASQNLGEIMVETGYRLTTNPDTVRAPDVSFLSAKNVPATGLPEGYISGAPDLAVEIVSPNDKASDIQAKVEDYLAHGTQLVWVVYPQQKLVVAHYPNGTARTLHHSNSDSLTGEPALPNFSCPLTAIFS